MAKLAALAVVMAVAGAAIVLIGSDDDAGSSVSAVPAEARDGYFVGSSFRDLPLTEVLVPPNGAGDSTSFIYGDCELAGDAGCAPPLEIQTWDICDRFPATARVSRLTGLRGALAQFAPGEERAEVYTGTKAVVIFGDADLARRAIDELRPAGAQQASPELPPPNARAC
jgi:hypothetical protein